MPLLKHLQVRDIVEDSNGTTTSYPSQYQVKRCSSNMTYVDFAGAMTPEQTERVERCVLKYIGDSAKGLQQAHANAQMRYTSHTYLNNKSCVIEAGGHLGRDIEGLDSRYHPAVYTVLEPVPKFHKILVKKFQKNPNIILFNFGVNTDDGTFFCKSQAR